MINSKNTFKQVMAELNKNQGPVILTDDNELTAEQKKQLVKQTHLYIQLEEIIAELSTDLAPNEEIAGYLPFTNEDNSAIATSGLMGMTYVTQPQAKKYRDDFLDLRGNRMLIFTNERMIFTVLIEFLEERRYYSYPYETIKGIRFEPHTVGYFEWQKGALPRRKKTGWYTLDFQSNTNIFTEFLQPADAHKFEELVNRLPKLKAITIDQKTHRNTLFDQFFSNTNMSVRFFTGLFILLTVLLLVIIVFQLLTGQGPLVEQFDHNAAVIYWATHHDLL